MIGIKMKPNIPVHYQKGNTSQKGTPTPNIQPPPAAPPPPPPQFFCIFVFISYALK